MCHLRNGSSPPAAKSKSFAVAALCVLIFAGCAALPPATDYEIDTPQGITLQKVSSEGEQHIFVLKNSSDDELLYRHWFAGGPRPVLSIESIAGGRIKRYDEWPVGDYSSMTTHSQILFPGEQIEF